MEDNNKTTPVRVALRVRPLVPREIKEGCQECLDISSDSPQVVVRGTEKAFTFDYAFSSDKSQQYIYDSSIANAIQQLLKGHNVTILAYGQTGSGKTYSMGTSHTNIGESEADVGIIPRAITDVFSQISESSQQEISVKVSFIELYKKVLYDLLNQGRRDNTIFKLREDPDGRIKFAGLTEIPVASLDETMKCLEYGALNRATGATAMNSRSSRSHAIFSLHLEIKNKEDTDNLTSAKFHLVDLAGSENAKKTCTTGERFKEGININAGLLALGNVISSICGEGSRGGYIPYRDSELTRLLKDSLGGNSHTIMIACVSPADSNLKETLRTLRYADRATITRHIRKKNVEAIAGMREINGYPEYKVRWKGWAPKYDTWLKEDELLNCPEILKNFKTVLEKLEQQEDWQVEEILDTRKRKGKPEYLVHWKGFESKCDSWEPEENLEGCKDVLEKYLKQGEKQKNILLKEGRRTRDKTSARTVCGKLYRWKSSSIEEESK